MPEGTMKDPYEVLGVTKDADIKDIKKSYRKLARALHPDLRPGDKAAEDRFKEVASAYDFLSDEKKKQAYDRGEIDAAGTPKAERRFYRDFAETGSGTRYADPGEYFHDIEGMDVFADLFRGARRDAHKMRGADIQQRVEVDFLDAVNGASRELVLPDGRRLKVTIPAGTINGQTLRLKGQGGVSPGGGASGDLHLEIHVRPHPQFTRKDNDIWADLPITLGEAVLGGKIEVPTIDGTVSMTVPKGSNTGTRLRVRGKGVPVAGGRGDHYVTLQVVLPDPPDDELIRLIEQWSASHPYRVR
jgi:DnaJ-class molecular chaperone